MLRRVFGCVAAFVALRAALPAADPTLKYPMTQRTDHTDDLPRHQGRRPLPLARRRRAQVADVPSLGRAENKVTDAYLKAIPERDGHPEAAHRAVELRDVTRRPVQSRRPLLLHAGTTACKTRPSSTRRTSSTAEPRVLLDPNKWSKDGTVALAGLVGQRRRQVPRLRRRRGRLRLEHLARPRHRHRQAARRRIEVGRSSAGPPGRRTARASSTAATTSRRRARSSRALNRQPEGLLPRDRHAADRRRARLSAARPPDWGFHDDVTEDGHYLVITIWKGTDSQVPRRL